MNKKFRVFFEFRVPLISYLLMFATIIFLYLFGRNFTPLHLKVQQCGILLMSLGFVLRILASATTKYMGKLKITGIYAVCRQPLLLSQLVSVLGLNLIVSDIFFLLISMIIFFCNDYLAMKKYDKILAHQYRDIWNIYSGNTNFVLPFNVRMQDVLRFSISANEMEGSRNLPIFLVIYLILIEIATLSGL